MRLICPRCKRQGQRNLVQDDVSRFCVFLCPCGEHFRGIYANIVPGSTSSPKSTFCLFCKASTNIDNLNCFNCKKELPRNYNDTQPNPPDYIDNALKVEPKHWHVKDIIKQIETKIDQLAEEKYPGNVSVWVSMWTGYNTKKEIYKQQLASQFPEYVKYKEDQYESQRLKDEAQRIWSEKIREKELAEWRKERELNPPQPDPFYWVNRYAKLQIDLWNINQLFGNNKNK